MRHARAQAAIREAELSASPATADFLDKIDTMLERKEAALERIRQHLRLKALLEIWLHIHVPLTFALIAALFVHIFAVFFYWG